MNHQPLTEGVFYILLSLNEALHGYGIMQKVESLSNRRLKLAAGTLYGAINKLLEKEWIEDFLENSDTRKKEYIITQKGKEVLQIEINRLKELVESAQIVLNDLDKISD